MGGREHPPTPFPPPPLTQSSENIGLEAPADGLKGLAYEMGVGWDVGGTSGRDIAY